MSTLPWDHSSFYDKVSDSFWDSRLLPSVSLRPWAICFVALCPVLPSLKLAERTHPHLCETETECAWQTESTVVLINVNSHQ